MSRPVGRAFASLCDARSHHEPAKTPSCCGTLAQPSCDQPAVGHRSCEQRAHQTGGKGAHARAGVGRCGPHAHMLICWRPSRRHMKRPSIMSPSNRITYVMTYAEALTKLGLMAPDSMCGAREVRDAGWEQRGGRGFERIAPAWCLKRT
jgi:hypothetical protein